MSNTAHIIFLVGVCAQLHVSGPLKCRGTNECEVQVLQKNIPSRYSIKNFRVSSGFKSPGFQGFPQFKIQGLVPRISFPIFPASVFPVVRQAKNITNFNQLTMNFISRVVVGYTVVKSDKLICKLYVHTANRR